LSPEKQKRKLVAILSANADGGILPKGEDEPETLQTLKNLRQGMLSLIEKHRGRVVDSPGSTGGHLLAEFTSVADAVQCAIQIQEQLQARNEVLPKRRRILFRIGIHLGDVTEEDGMIGGDGVDVASGLEGLADAGGICISGSAYDQVKNRVLAGYEPLGQNRVQNIAEPVRAYRVQGKPKKTGGVVGRPGLLSYLEKRLDLIKVIVLALSVMVGIAGLYNTYFRTSSPPVGVASVQRMALPLPDKPSIAVLPFENMTGDPKQEYFADGFTEEIITSLSKIPALFVISRTSSFSYKGKPVKVQQVSEELGVRYVLEGSVQKSSSRIRINVQLIDAISGKHLWSEHYDRDLKDIFALQDEVILKIASALSVNLTMGEQARRWAEGTKNLEAYLKLMQGRAYLYQGNRESNALARRMAEEAIALDPKYAEAYVVLSITHTNDVFLGTSRPKESIPKAMELTQKALALNGSLADAHSKLGLLYVWSGRYDEAIAETERAVELDPNSGQLNYNLSTALRFAGNSKDAIPVILKALRQEPIAPDNYVQQKALAYFQAGECQNAIATCEKGPWREPDNLMTHVIRAMVYGFCDSEEEARKEAIEVLRIKPKFTVRSFTGILPYKNPSDRERAAQGLRKAGLP
jgi:adenylate cyclase